MSSAAEVVDTFIAAWGRKDLDEIMGFFTDDAVYENVPIDPPNEGLEAIRKTGGRDLVSARLFDRYEGKGIPAGKVSLGFRLVFQRHDRTLTDVEVNKRVDRVDRVLCDKFGGVRR